MKKIILFAWLFYGSSCFGAFKFTGFDGPFSASTITTTSMSCNLYNDFVVHYLWTTTQAVVDAGAVTCQIEGSVSGLDGEWSVFPLSVFTVTTLTGNESYGKANTGFQLLRATCTSTDASLTTMKIYLSGTRQ